MAYGMGWVRVRRFPPRQTDKEGMGEGDSAGARVVASIAVTLICYDLP
jgi:hypothetical protein